MRVGGLVVLVGMVVAGVLAAACGGSKPRETAMAHGGGGSGGGTTAGIGTGAGGDGAPGGGSAAGAGGIVNGTPCTEHGRQVREPLRWCICADVCSGAEPETPPPPEWQCVNRDPACPDDTPTDRAACARPGLACGYGFCGGASATCGADGRWTVRQFDPPA